MGADSIIQGGKGMTRLCWRGSALGLACSISMPALPLFANTLPSVPVWHASQGNFATLHHNVNTANNGNSSIFRISPSIKAGLAPASLQPKTHSNSFFTSLIPGNNDLNLASSQPNIFASNLAGFHTLTIIVGGVKQVVSLDSKLTGGEAVAAQQVLDGGRQTITLARDGEAIGGTVTLNNNLITALDSALGGSINTLTIAHGVKVIDTLGLLTVNGAIDNAGWLLTASSTARGSDTIAAGSIVNAAGATIASYSGSGQGLYAASPILATETALTNSGTISSANALTINAPIIYNSGTISAANITAGSNGALSVVNSGGTIRALYGDISFYSTNNSLNVTGGDFLSRQFNLSSQSGDINVNASTISGVINAAGNSVHVETTNNQNLGDITTSGDPQFVSSGGNITINGTIAPTDGADLAIIAGGNILSTANGVIATSALTGGNGGNLTLIAGAHVIGDDTTATVSDSTDQGKGSTTGGIIDLTGGHGGQGALSQLTTAGTGTAGNGGYIEMVAYAGSSSGSGTIIVSPKTTINASGSGTGTSGDVTLIAGAARETAISTGAIVGNNITLLSETPTANGGQAAGVVFNQGTSNLGNSGFTGVTNQGTATLAVGTITAAQDLTIKTGGSQGSASKPITFTADQLTLSATSKSASGYYEDTSGEDLTVAGAQMGSAGTFSLGAPANKITDANGGIIDITGPISAGTVKISAPGTTSSIVVQNVISGNKATLSTSGDITSSGAGDISATNLSLTGASINTTTNAASLTASAKSGNITIDQGTSALNITAKFAGSNTHSLVVDSQNQINLENAVNLGSLGTIVLDDQAASGGVKLTGAIAAGTISLTSGSAGLTASGGASVTAGNITLVSRGAIGASSRAFKVDNNLAAGLGNTLTIKAGTNQSAYINEIGTNDLTFDAGSFTTSKNLVLTAMSSALNVVEAPFQNVQITDKNSSGDITLNVNSSASVLFGTGSGYFNVTTNGDISMNVSNTGIKATSVSLTSNQGNIGQTGEIILDTPTVNILALKDNASVTDSASGNIALSGNALAAFDFIATGKNTNITVITPISAANILLSAEGAGSNIKNLFTLGNGARDEGNTITITPTGNLTIDGRLIADYIILGGNKFTGDPILLGTVNINKPMTVDHSINVFVDQSAGINISAPVRGNQIRFVTSNANANIVIKAPITTVGDLEDDGTILTLQANGANIVSAPGVVVSAADINLTGINIGSPSLPLATVGSYMNLGVNGGAAYIANTGNIILNPSNPITATTLSFTNKGSLTFDGSITASVLNLTASGSVALGVAGESPVSNLTGTTSLTINAPSGVIDAASLTGPNIVVNTNSFVVNGITLSFANNLTIKNQSGGLLVDGVLSGPDLVLSSSGALSLGSAQDQFQTMITSPSLSLIGSVINNYGLVSGKAVSATTSNFSNQMLGTIGATSILNFSNPQGNLTLNGPAGSIIPPAGGALTLGAKGTILAGTAANVVIAPADLDKLHSLTINAGGTFTSPFPDFTAVPDSGGNGGIINITAANLVYNGAPLPPVAVDITANGSTNNGGQIFLKLTNVPAGVFIGNGIGDYNLDASGANGGTVEVLSSSNLTVSMNSLAFQSAPSGNGGNLTLIAGKNLLISGNVDTHNGVGGSYGKVTLQSNSSQPFAIGGNSNTVNGIINITGNMEEGVTGSAVIINNNSSVLVNAGFVIAATSAGITLNTTELINNGQVNTTGTLAINNASSIVVPTGTSGTYLPDMSGYAVSSNGGNVTINSALPQVSTLLLSAPSGKLTLPAGTTGLNVLSPGGNGGSISVTAESISPQLTALNAAASSSTGAGGSISFNLTGTKPLVIGSSLTFDIARGVNSSSGGSLTISNGGNLIVDGSALTIGPSLAGASGANLTLAAGTKNSGILVLSNLSSIANQAVDKLTLQSNSSQAFSLGGGAANNNGITDGGIALSAQTITIQNKSGGIVEGSGGVLTASATTAGAIDLLAGKSGIGLSPDAPVAISSSDLAINTAGSAYISNTLNVSLDGVITGKAFDYTSAAGITASASLVAPSLVLNLSSITPTLQTPVTNSLSVTTATGAIVIIDQSPTTVTINNLASSGPVSLTTAGAINISAGATVAGSAVTLTSGGSAGNILAGANITSAGIVSLNAAGKGTISEKNLASITAATLNLNSQNGNIGVSAGNPLVIEASALSVTTGTNNNAFIENSATTTIINGSSIGNVFSYSGNITGTSGTVAAQSLSLILGNTTALLKTNASTITGSTFSGDLSVQDSQTAPIILKSLSAGAGQLAITSGGSITVAGPINAADGISLTAGGATGNILISKSINGQSGTVLLQSNGLGNISAGSGATITGQTVELITQGSDVGASNKALSLNANNLEINTGNSGNVYLSNNDLLSSGIVTVAAITGSLQLTDTNKTANNNGTLDLTNISAGTGAINIGTNEQTLQTDAGAAISTVNGNIVLQNTFKNNAFASPLITIGDNSTIHASALLPSNLGAGNVYIVLGALPTSASLRPGTAPLSAPTINVTNGGAVTFGTTSNINGSITAVSSDTLNGLGRTLAFNTGNNDASQIVLGNNVTITADPPVNVSQTQVAINSPVYTKTNEASSNYTLPVKNETAATQSLTASPSQSPLSFTSASASSASTKDIFDSWSNSAQWPAYRNAQNFSDATLRSVSDTKANVGGRQEEQKLTGEVSNSNGNVQSLERGALMITPNQDTIVATPMGMVSVSKNSVCLIIAAAQALTVFNLHDAHKNSVIVQGNNKTYISLSPGQNATISTRGIDHFEQVNPSEKVTYRKMAVVNAAQEQKVFRGEFELFSLLRSLAPLTHMMQSNDLATRKTANRVIKTAAILAQINGGEAYSPIAAPRFATSLANLAR